MHDCCQQLALFHVIYIIETFEVLYSIENQNKKVLQKAVALSLYKSNLIYTRFLAGMYKLIYGCVCSCSLLCLIHCGLEKYMFRV